MNIKELFCFANLLNDYEDYDVFDDWEDEDDDDWEFDD